MGVIITVTRKERFLNAAITQTPLTEAAVTRIEMFLNAIANGSADVPTPITRVEQYLAKIAGADAEVPTPVTRIEMYLAKVAGEDIEPPTPVTRIEQLLATWTGGGSVAELLTVTGVAPLALANALARPLVSLVQDGKVSQNGTPTPSVPVDIVCNNGTLVMVDDELPSGYNRIAGITFDSSVYYQITDFFLKGSDTIRISFSVEKACNVFGCYTTTSATNNYSLYASTAANAKYLRYAGGTYKSQFATSTFGQRFDVVITPTGSSGMPSGQNDTWNESDFTATSALCIAHTSPSGTSSKLDGNIYGDIVVDGRLKLIPCIRLSDGEIGYYDTYTEAFYAPVTGTPVSLGYDLSHLTLKVVGTAEVLSVGTQTASVADLFATGDYADSQNIITGAITRKVVARRLTSDETSWYLSDSGDVHRFRCRLDDAVYKSGRGTDLLCSHYRVLASGSTAGGCFLNGSSNVEYLFCIPEDQTIDTVEKWGTWLDNNAVTIIYPLAESTTESAAPQHITLTKGDDTVSVTAEVSGINLTAQYYAEVTE